MRTYLRGGRRELRQCTDALLLEKDIERLEDGLEHKVIIFANNNEGLALTQEVGNFLVNM